MANYMSRVEGVVASYPVKGLGLCRLETPRGVLFASWVSRKQGWAVLEGSPEGPVVARVGGIVEAKNLAVSFKFAPVALVGEVLSPVAAPVFLALAAPEAVEIEGEVLAPVFLALAAPEAPEAVEFPISLFASQEIPAEVEALELQGFAEISAEEKKSAKRASRREAAASKRQIEV